MGTTGAAGGSSRKTRSSKAAKSGFGTGNTENAVKQEEVMAEQEKVSNGEAAEASKSGKLELSKKPEGNGGNGRNESSLSVQDTASDSGAIQHASGGYLSERPIEHDGLEIAETFYSAGLRPIAASHLAVFGTILNGRPIQASSLQVAEFALPGNRPVFASEIIVRDDLTLPGGRPIVASDPRLLEPSLLPGGRPIASNDIDDSATLMGYID